MTTNVRLPLSGSFSDLGDAFVALDTLFKLLPGTPLQILVLEDEEPLREELARLGMSGRPPQEFVLCVDPKDVRRDMEIDLSDLFPGHGTVKYHLRSIILFNPDCEPPHYYCNVWHGDKNKWYRLNDNDVRPAAIRGCARVLVYEKKE